MDRTRDAAEGRLQDAVRLQVGQARYDLWFSQHTRFVIQGDGVVVGVPNAHYQEWIQKTFSEVIREAIIEVFGRPLGLKIVADEGLFPASPGEPEPAPEPNKPAEKANIFEGAQTRDLDREPQVKGKRIGPGRRWHSLNDFVVGACNRVAAASAHSVVEEPGQGANPLVIFGPIGVGKTHLLEGVYVGLRKAWPEARITFSTAEEFTNRFVQAMRFGKVAGFRRHFRDASALLIDDLSFLASKRATQEEFLHTLDVLVADGRQVVVTGDCHPKLADELMPELADRLVAGAVWGLMPPDPATRLAILRAKAGKKGGTVPEKILKYLAERLRGNVRELEGALKSIRHFARVTGKPVDEELAREALGDLFLHAIRVVRVLDVDQAVCGVLRLPHGSLQSKQRSWAVSHPRMVAIYLSRKHTAATYGEISKHFGGKTHSTAVAAEKKVRQWLTDGHKLSLGGREWTAKELVERAEREVLK